MSYDYVSFPFSKPEAGRSREPMENAAGACKKRGEVGGVGQGIPLLRIFSHLLAVSFSHVLFQIMNTDYAGQQAIVHPQRHYYAQRKGDDLSKRLTSQVTVFHRVMLLWMGVLLMLRTELFQKILSLLRTNRYQNLVYSVISFMDAIRVVSRRFYGREGGGINA